MTSSSHDSSLAFHSSGPAALPIRSASSCNPASTSSSSSDNEDSPPHPLSSNLSQSEQRRRRSRGEEEGEGKGRKRRRKNHRRTETHEEEEDAGRFVGRMAVCVRGGGTEEEEAPLTLHNFNHRKHRREGGVATQSEHSVTIIRRNGYTAPMLLHR